MYVKTTPNSRADEQPHNSLSQKVILEMACVANGDYCALTRAVCCLIK